VPRTLFQSGSLKSSSTSGSSRATTDNLNHSVHLTPAAPVQADLITVTSSGRVYAQRPRHAADRRGGGDMEDSGRDERSGRRPAFDVAVRGEWCSVSRQSPSLACAMIPWLLIWLFIYYYQTCTFIRDCWYNNSLCPLVTLQYCIIDNLKLFHHLIFSQSPAPVTKFRWVTLPQVGTFNTGRDERCMIFGQ